MPEKAFFTSRSAKLSSVEDKFDIYLNELIEWNKKFNLTSVTDPEEIRIRHFEDSLSVLQAIDLKNQKVVDVGAGAGFPGIPLKIVCPGIKLTLIEATRKKVDFLNHIIKILKLDNTEAIWGRAEDLGKDSKYYGKYHVALARAVAKLPDLIKYCLPLLRPNGIFIAMKQDEVEEEVNEAKKALEKFYGTIKEIKKVEVGGVRRSLVIFEKIA